MKRKTNEVKIKKKSFLRSIPPLLIPIGIGEIWEASSLKPPEVKQTHLTFFFCYPSPSATVSAVNTFLRFLNAGPCSLSLRVSSLLVPPFAWPVRLAFDAITDWEGRG